MEQKGVAVVPMTRAMYHEYLKEYENDPDLLMKGQAYQPYVYSAERAERYIDRQKDLGRVPLAILYDGEIVGEIVIKNIEAGKCATMGLALKNAKYKDRGIGTAAEKLAVGYVFQKLGIPTLYADALKTNARSLHVLEKVGFRKIGEDENFVYFRIDRDPEPDCGSPREGTAIGLYKPELADLWFRSALLADEETMSYNRAWGGTISFPEEDRADWYARWVADPGKERFYRYILDERGAFIGEIAYHFDRELGGYTANVIVHAKYRGRGYGGKALDALIAAAKERGIARLYDDIAIGNPAAGMFLRRGFSEVGRTKDKIILMKEL